MSYLRGAGVHFDETSVVGVRFQNKIKAVESGKVEPPRHFFYCDRHLPMIDQAQNGSVSSCMHLFQDLEMQRSQHRTLPAEDCAGGFASLNKRLRIYHESLAQQGRPEQGCVVSDERALGRSREYR